MSSNGNYFRSLTKASPMGTTSTAVEASSCSTVEEGSSLNATMVEDSSSNAAMEEDSSSNAAMKEDSSLNVASTEEMAQKCPLELVE